VSIAHNAHTVHECGLFNVTIACDYGQIDVEFNLNMIPPLLFAYFVISCPTILAKLTRILLTYIMIAS
jgi:hypothetical protein